LFASLGYNYLKSLNVIIEAEITGDAFAFNPALGNVNDATLSNSNMVIKPFHWCSFKKMEW
jgi:hypothetical protein